MILKSKLSWKAYAAMFISIIALSIGCNPEEDTESNDTSVNSLESLDAFFSFNQPTIQEFSLDASVSNQITGEKGTRIFIPQNAFVDANGTPVQGNVSFQLQEIFSPAEMIFTDRMTVSDDEWLSSGGELFIEATQNGNELELAPGSEITVDVPTDNADPQMAVFIGNDDADLFNWVADTSLALDTVADTTSFQRTYYSFQLPNIFNWINCDYFWNDPRPKTDVEIIVPSGFDNFNTRVYAYIPSVNSMASVYYDYATSSFFINNGYQLPIGIDVTFVGIRVNSSTGSIDYAIQTATIVNNHIEYLSFQNISSTQLAALLSNL